MKTDEKKQKRVYITLNLENKEDKEVFDILEKKKNVNYYIRQAVLYFNKGVRLDERTREDIREVVRESMQEFLSGDLAEGKNQNMNLPEDVFEVPAQSEPADKVSKTELEKEAVVPELEDEQIEVGVNKEDEEQETNLDLSGFEMFFGE